MNEIAKNAANKAMERRMVIRKYAITFLGILLLILVAVLCLTGIYSTSVNRTRDYLIDITRQDATVLDERVKRMLTELDATAGFMGETTAASPSDIVMTLAHHMNSYKRTGMITRDGRVYTGTGSGISAYEDPFYSEIMVAVDYGSNQLIIPRHADSDGKSVIVLTSAMTNAGGTLFAVCDVSDFASMTIGESLYDQYLCVAGADGSILFSTQLLCQVLSDCSADSLAQASNAILENSSANYSMTGWGDYQLTTSPLGFNGWTITRFTPNSEISNTATRLISISMILALTCVAVIAGLSSYMLLRRARFSENRAREAETDSLTGIYNNMGFTHAAAPLLRNPGQRYALVFMRTDAQEIYSARYGYESGRRALENIARLINAECDSGEICGRLEGGQFMMLVRYNDTADTIMRVKSLNSHIMTLGVMHLRNHFGIYIPTGKNEKLTHMIERASAASRRVMLKGDLLGLYDDALHNRQIYEDALVSRVPAAIAAGEFEVRYRPIRDASTLEIVSAEAVALWHQPDGAILKPSQYVPLLARNAMLGPLNMYILERACADLRRDMDSGHTPGRIMVNVSRENILDGTFLPTAQQTLARYNIAGERLEVLMDESMFTGDGALMKNIITQMHTDKLHVCAGGFGIGATSLDIFYYIPVDTIRFNSAFIGYTCESGKGRSLLSGLISLAKSMDMQTCADGALTHDQLEYLKQSGCDMVERLHTDNLDDNSYCSLTDIKSPTVEKPYDPFDDWA